MRYKTNLNELKKPELFNLGVEITKEFCKINDIEYPDVRQDDTRIKKGPGARGYYTQRHGFYEVVVDLSGCRPPTKTPGFAWSYPGYKSDITPMGVVAHEIGHHCHYWKAWPDEDDKSDFPRSPQVTSYEPNVKEAIAESFRLFILNPDLLKKITPLRYEYFKDWGIKSVIEDDWQTVLKDAHPKFIENILKNY